eukprot:TRINITY_DN14013_c0_g1_i1.p1 TRINITY_DN14013_c0_g1~~TRINITY_DN14013_c0_g1_i1.p1  ORF type:complete len:282 (+),score=95.58 TRINITY_DN14013_c0_g1_i1:104-949(+)
MPPKAKSPALTAAAVLATSKARNSLEAGGRSSSSASLEGRAKAKPSAVLAKAKAAAAKPKAKAEAKAEQARPVHKEAKEVEEAFEKVVQSSEEVKPVDTEDAERQHLADAERQRLEEAERQRLAALANGEVTVKYSMYSEKFPIVGHALDAKLIDETYCLSDVMPGCFIHLAEKEFAHGEEHVYVQEEPKGIFLGLMAGSTYWCYVQQDAEQEKRDQERMRKLFEGGVKSGIGDRDLGKLSCTCCDGLPCDSQRQNVCLDWENRFVIAEKARRPLAAGFAT